MNLRLLCSRLALNLLVASTLIWHQPTAVAGGIYIISHPSIKLDVSEVREVFLGEKSFLGSVKLSPVDNAVAQADFQSRIMMLDADRYRTYWTKKSFRDGINPPPVKSSDAEVSEFVRRTPGAIGYVYRITGGVVVVGEF